MASLEEFRALLHEGNIQQAFTDYELDFNAVAFDTQAGGYEADIVWHFESPNKIKMNKKTASDADAGKRIYYLPWKSKSVTSVTLDADSAPYFVTSHFSNCRFTINFHDGAGKKVTVMHVAGDVSGGSTVRGSKQRDELESTVPLDDVQSTRRLSIVGHKRFGKAAANHMAQAKTQGTSYYDTYARVFGARTKSGAWVFYAQDINGDGQMLGLNEI